MLPAPHYWPRWDYASLQLKGAPELVCSPERSSLRPGYLTPFKVRQFATTIDGYTFRCYGVVTP